MQIENSDSVFHLSSMLKIGRPIFHTILQMLHRGVAIAKWVQFVSRQCPGILIYLFIYLFLGTDVRLEISTTTR